ncbi:MAG: TolC family protein [Planctomyces sp.]|nr:TolC family protein [Planctomyces sp.]
MSVALVGAGCRNINVVETALNDTEEVDQVMARVDRPHDAPVLQEHPLAPVTLKTLSPDRPPEYWDITLDHAVGIAMLNNEVLRDLGATVLRAPDAVQTRYMKVLQESDPRFGMEAALSAFDAQLQATAYFQDNNRVVNNTLLSGTNSIFLQDRHDYVAQLSKLTATGGQMAVRHITDYDHNNAVSNLLSTSWQTMFEGELRQPLLQGGGLTFNRIAGPNALPGVSNGILIAKVNSDITAVEFERGVRDYVSDVVNAYWDLYFAYRDLDAKRTALTRARETWQSYNAEQQQGRETGASEALAREQYFRFQSELEDAIAGKVGQRSQAYNGVTGGVFRGVNGVQLAERRLRLLIGLPVTDGRTLRPIDDPEQAPVVFDWNSIVDESLRRRPEVRAQRLIVKRRELELLAARNFLSPRLDAVAVYRVRGLGGDLAGSAETAGLRSAYSELGTFEHQEWAAGVEFSVPFGFRRGHAAVDNAEFMLARDRALLREQERQVLHDLTNTLAEVDRAYKQSEINLNRYLAAQDAVDALEANRAEGLRINLEQLLDIQRRLTEAQSRYYQSRVEYAVALKNIHVEKGSVLEYADLQVMDSMAPITTAVDEALENARNSLPARPEQFDPAAGDDGDVAQARHQSKADGGDEAGTESAKRPATAGQIRVSSRQPTPAWQPERADTRQSPAFEAHLNPEAGRNAPTADVAAPESDPSAVPAEAAEDVDWRATIRDAFEGD